MKFNLIRLIVLILILSTSNIISQKKKYTLEDMYSNPSIYGQSLRGVKWIEGGDKFSFLKSEQGLRVSSIFSYDVKTGEENLLVSATDLKLQEDEEPLTIRNYEWSPDERYILFTGTLRARSVKSSGTFYLYDLNKKKFFVIAESEMEQVNTSFSPNGKKLAFVRGNNLFVTDIETKIEKQLTFDGSDVILNGHFDWVYEEEFKIIVGYDWSPDSKHIAFWRLDQSNVPVMKIAVWDSVYDRIEEMRYPKAGMNNSLVQIGVVNIDGAKTTWMDIGTETDIYIPRIKFTNDVDLLFIQRMNRLQNKLELLSADIRSGKTKIILTENDTAWVSVFDDLYLLNNEQHFIWSSERDNFKHLYLYDYSGNLVNQITQGNWEVDNLILVDEESNELYYTSNERGTIYTDLYSIKFDGTGKRRLTSEAGNHSADFSPNGRFYIGRYSNANLPASTSIYNNEGEKIRDIFLPNTSVFDEYTLSEVEFLTFTTSDGVELNAAMMVPPDFDETKKYPVIIYNYSGPGSQTVIDIWRPSLWNQVMTNNGYIIFMLDNRGTGGRGKDFKNIVYKNLGYWEVNDLIEGVKYLSTLPYVDSERIGIWGSSYGGYIAALAILKGADYFKAAVASALVSHWKFYDTIYTERYMQTPQLNPEGYEDSSPLNYADKLKGKLLIVHGTSDDNVHFQNTVQLVDQLIKHNKQFQTMFYPGKRHGGFGRHFIQLMTDFFLNNL
jgi:dipeptidyl-peptidase-4